jgi:hypothetical protein
MLPVASLSKASLTTEPPRHIERGEIWRGKYVNPGLSISQFRATFEILLIYKVATAL